MNQTLLVELLTEELPPKALAKLGDAFAAGIMNGLKARAFLESDSAATVYATPRRLAVSITNVRAGSPDKSIREKVLPVSVALDATGNPSAPLAKKLAALAALSNADNLGIADLERAPDGKADSFFYTYTAPGAPLQGSLQIALEEAIAKLPIPKVMSYQRPDGSTVQFVRPVHKLIALHGKNIVPVTILGLSAGKTTLGHRFLSQGELQIASADNYASVLEEQGKIIPGVTSRKETIRSALLAKAGNDKVLMPEALLDEVAALVEWPAVYECNFENEFLSVPQECLILTMQTNQKYFALTDAEGRLRSRFLIVSNLATDDPRHIIQGNERVVRPRLSDAKFFFEQDKKKKLADRIAGLSNVVYHNKLGTQAQRTERLAALAGKIAQALDIDIARAERGALLAKADLLTDMVGEFPELQGIMGTYYARHDGEHEEVALALSEHYQPRFAGDALPVTGTGTAVALADKLETLVGIWGIGLQPTGDKDPFALRRHALGILRMLIEKRLPLSLGPLLTETARLFEGNTNFKNPTTAVAAFVLDRLRGYLKEQGYDAQAIEAVLAVQCNELHDIMPRLDAVRIFMALPQAEVLIEANKRISKIVAKADAEGPTLSPEWKTYRDEGIHPEKLQESAELELFQLLQTKVVNKINHLDSEKKYLDILNTLSDLSNPIAKFFEEIFVMSEDFKIRADRVSLLNSFWLQFKKVADFSVISSKK
jgi:glycyl-tRNA synthetase beta chain